MPQSQWNEVWCSLDGLASQIESAWFIRIWVGLLLFQSLESYDFPPPLAFQPEARNAIVSACSCKSWRIHHSSSSSLVYLRTTYTFVGFNEERATRILSFLHRTIAFGVGGSLRRRTIKTTLPHLVPKDNVKWYSKGFFFGQLYKKAITAKGCIPLQVGVYLRLRRLQSWIEIAGSHK